METTDKTLQCADCGENFVFTAGEQEFYNEKGFKNEPKRCPKCRSSKKRRTREFSTVTCASCGKETRVPFKPTSGKPVFCKDCFENQRV